MGRGFFPDGKRILFSAPLYTPTGNPPELFVFTVGSSQPPQGFCGLNGNPKLNKCTGTEPTISSDGKSILIQDDNNSFLWHIYRMNADGTGRLEVTKNMPVGQNRNNSDGVLSPDGKRVFFLSTVMNNSRTVFKQELWEVDGDGKNPRIIAGSNLFDNPLTWKPSR